MKVSFEITADDVVAAYQLHYAHSRTTLMPRIFLRLIGPLCALYAAYFFEQNAEPNGANSGISLYTIIFVGLGCAGFFLLPWGKRKFITRAVRRQLAADPQKGTLIGTWTMELAGHRLLTKTELDESAFDLKAIKDIVVFDGYMLIYLTSIMFYVVPLKGVLPESDYRDFAASLRRTWEAGRAPPRTEIKPPPPDTQITRPD